MQPVVDFVKLLQRSRLMAKSLHHFDIANGFINQAGLFAPGQGLQPEHGVGACGNEIGNHQ